MYVLVQRENFRKMTVKSTIFELQKSFLYIFGVAQNFQFNGGDFMSHKRGIGGGDPSFLCIRPWNLIISTKITYPLKPLVTVPPIFTNWLWILFDKLYHWERLISYFIYSSIQTYIYVNFPIHAHRKRNSFCANYKYFDLFKGCVLVTF